jgi:hypothetical protein
MYRRNMSDVSELIEGDNLRRKIKVAVIAAP